MSKYQKTIGPRNNYYSPFRYCLSIQPRKEAKTQWENPTLNMDRKKQNFGNLVINHASQHYQQSPTMIWDWWRSSHKKLWWRCLLLILNMHRRVGEWCHHAQAVWCSAYGSQCVWFSVSKLDHCRFKWCSDYHNR